MGVIGGMFVLSVAFGGEAMTEPGPTPGNEVALNFSKGVVDLNEKSVVDPNIKSIIDPNVKTVIDPNIKTVIDPNFRTELNPNMLTGLPAVQQPG